MAARLVDAVAALLVGPVYARERVRRERESWY